MTDEIARLGELLDARRAELHAIDGVIASGVGHSSAGGVAIQLFVRSREDVSEAEQVARALLGEVPLEVVVGGEVTAADVEGGGGNG
jgi:hypothetical protein